MSFVIKKKTGRAIWPIAHIRGVLFSVNVRIDFFTTQFEGINRPTSQVRGKGPLTRPIDVETISRSSIYENAPKKALLKKKNVLWFSFLSSVGTN